MQRLGLRCSRFIFQTKRERGRRLELEGLEQRQLLATMLGDQWTFGSRITYSLMPDGTSVGGIPSVLFQTLNAHNPTVSWEQQIEQAASLWENVDNINVVMVPDGGEPVGTSGNQQDDPRFGDIRIGAVPLSTGTLAETFLPPAANGGTDAGDIILNSNINWQINSNYDLMTVVAHEFGHALGLGESTSSSAVMYGTYNGIKQALTSDDITGIQSIYGARQFDQFNSGSQRNNTYMAATNISAQISKNAQIAIPNLDITTAGDSEWYYVSVPASTAGTMTITVQSNNLSSLSPELQVYNSSLSLVGQAVAKNSLGATISLGAGVQSGQGYYIKVLAAGGPGPIGHYGLMVNFGSQTQSPIAPPNTAVAQEPDQGGFTSNAIGLTRGGGLLALLEPIIETTIGDLTGWVETYTVNGSLLGLLSLSISGHPGASTPPQVQLGPGTSASNDVQNPQVPGPVGPSSTKTLAPQIIQVAPAPPPRPVQASEAARRHVISTNRKFPRKSPRNVADVSFLHHGRIHAIAGLGL